MACSMAYALAEPRIGFCAQRILQRGMQHAHNVSYTDAEAQVTNPDVRHLHGAAQSSPVLQQLSCARQEATWVPV